MTFNKIQKSFKAIQQLTATTVGSKNSGEFIDYTMQDVSSGTSGTELVSLWYEIFMLGYKQQINHLYLSDFSITISWKTLITL